MTNSPVVMDAAINAVSSTVVTTSTPSVASETLNGALANISAMTTSLEFLVGVLVGACVCYLAGAQVRRVRSIGSKRPKRKRGTPGMIELYVGNLSYETDEDQLRAEFEKFGSVKSVRIISNRFNHKSKGFGFIEMPNRNEAEAAIKAMNDRDMQGRRLRVNEARNKTA